MANYTTTITNEGAALLASVIANQGTLTFNEFRFSENDYTGQESTLTEGTFLGVFITAGAAASVIDSTTIKASAQFDNSTITGNHDLYSIGIVGTDGNTTALIAVCTTTDPDVIREPLTGTSTYAFNVNLSVSDTSQITVVGTTAAVIYDIDVIDNLTSPATNKPLSANQGRLIADNLAANENVYGAKQMLPYPFYDTTKTDSGITFTDNGNGTLTINGTASADAVFILYNAGSDYAQRFAGKTILANISGGNAKTYFAGQADNQNFFYTNDEAQATFPLSYNSYLAVYIIVENGAVITTPITISFMLRDARVLDPTFAPYAKTNKQLTDDKSERADLTTIHATGSTNSTGATINAGTFFYLNGSYCKALTNIANGATFTESTNYKKDTVNGAIADLHKNQIAVNTSVDISSYTSTSNAFEVPADGYAVLNAQTTPSGVSSLTIYGSDISTSINFTVSLINPTGNYQGTSVFVRKGMHVVCASLQVGHVAIYDPLT